MDGRSPDVIPRDSFHDRIENVPLGPLAGVPRDSMVSVPSTMASMCSTRNTWAVMMSRCRRVTENSTAARRFIRSSGRADSTDELRDLDDPRGADPKTARTLHPVIGENADIGSR